VRDSSISTREMAWSNAFGSSENPRPDTVGGATARPLPESTATVIAMNPPSPSTSRSDRVDSPTSPTVSGRGFSDDPKALDQAISLVEMELSRTEAEGITDSHRIAQAVRRVVGRWVAETYRRRPMIVPTIIPVN